MKTLIDKVKQWRHDKGILGKDGKGTLKGQSKKMIEEANETLVAVSELHTFLNVVQTENTNSEYDFAMQDYEEKLREECMDGIGDVLVTLILLADMLDVTLEECLSMAYEEIANRQGKMIDGTFVKDK